VLSQDYLTLPAATWRQRRELGIRRGGCS